MQALKIIKLDDGTYAVGECDVTEQDMAGATKAESMDEAIEMLRSMLQDVEMSEPGMEMDDDAAFETGFKAARGVAF